MILIASVVFGVLLGMRMAKVRGGRGIDQAQYAAVMAILFAVIGLFVTIFIDRMI